MDKNPMVYILASKPYGALYVGVTSNLSQRTWKHKNGATGGFAGRYDVYQLVYFERHTTMMGAIRREKQIKKWNRAWKLDLIETQNPDWNDLWYLLVNS